MSAGVAILIVMVWVLLARQARSQGRPRTRPSFYLAFVLVFGGLAAIVASV